MTPEALAAAISDQDCLVNAAQLRKLLGCISEMTLFRWRGDPDLHFPAPLKINTRNYWRRGEIEDWIAELAAESEAV